MRRTGRPPGITAIRSPLAVAKAVAAIRSEGPYASQEATAEFLGVHVRTLQRYLDRHEIAWPISEVVELELSTPFCRGHGPSKTRRWAA